MDRTMYLGANGGAGPSPSVWGYAPVLDVVLDPNEGYALLVDFVNGLPNVDSQAADGGAGVTAVSELGGACKITTGGTDNNEAIVQFGGADAAAVFRISDGAGEQKKLFFECRVKADTVTDAKAGFFVGLAASGVAAADGLIADDGTLADKDLIGFFRPEGDGDGVDFVYRKNGQAVQTAIADVATIAADTYVKLGFIYDPAAVASKKIAVFVNGVEQNTYVTAANIAAATFPDAVLLQAAAGIKTAEDVDHNIQLGGFVRVLQLR